MTRSKGILGDTPRFYCGQAQTAKVAVGVAALKCTVNLGHAATVLGS
ncbi:hypothetical protein [Azospirillum lipoferum]|nr:hypothetical protein [Azospirillum lipoferum]